MKESSNRGTGAERKSLLSRREIPTVVAGSSPVRGELSRSVHMREGRTLG